MSRSKSFLMLAAVAALTFSIAQPFNVSQLRAVPAQETNVYQVEVAEFELLPRTVADHGVTLSDREDGSLFWDMLSSPVSAPVLTLINDGGAVDLFGLIPAPAPTIADRFVNDSELLASL